MATVYLDVHVYILHIVVGMDFDREWIVDYGNYFTMHLACFGGVALSIVTSKVALLAAQHTQTVQNQVTCTRTDCQLV